MTDENILDADVELFRKLFRPAPAEQLWGGTTLDVYTTESKN